MSSASVRRIRSYEEWRELARKFPRRWIVYGIEDKPPSIILSIFLGIQQYLIMFGATVAVPMLVSTTIADTFKIPANIRDIFMMDYITITFFGAGITTLLQTWHRVGSGLPIIQGSSFSFLAVVLSLIAMGKTVIPLMEGYKSLSDFIAATDPVTRWNIVGQYITGAILAASLFEIILGYSGIAGKLKRVITPVSIGPTIVIIGLSLYGAAATYVPQCWWEALLVIILIVVFNQIIGRRYVKIQMFSVLLSIVIAWVIAAALTFAGVIPWGSPAAIRTASLEYVIKHAYYARAPIPFPWGIPKVAAPFALGMLAAYLASMVESIGDYHSVCRMAEAPPPTERMISKGLGAEGLGCAIGALFGNINGSTSYSENIGAIGLTRVASRYVFQLGGALIMILGGVIYAWGAFMATMPKAIVGGMYMVTFGMIAAVGLSLLSLCDMKSGRNIFIVGVSLFAGLTIPAYFKGYNPYGIHGAGSVINWFHIHAPGWEWVGSIIEIIGETGMAVGAIFGIILDNLLPGTPEERGLTHPEWAA